MAKRCAAALFCVIILINVTVPVNGQVRINEFMAYNTSINPDMCDYDDFSDWIELYNTTDSAIDLKGYYLSDNLNNPTKWAIPEGAVIPPNGFFVVWADGADAKPGTVDTLDSYQWNVPFTTRRYHTNFKLSDLGDEIGLYKSTETATVLIDSVSFLNQLVDVSWGRNPTDNKWYEYDQPTPGAPNATDGKSVLLYSGSVSFSIAAGFYTEAQTLTLTTSSGDIYYTTDGSIPYKTSTKYAGPIPLAATTVIRARCIEPDKLAGKVATATYFINEPTRSLMKISITTDTTFLYDSTIGVFTNSFKGREVPISMEIFTPDGQLVSKVNSGMTLGSMTNFTCPQKPLQVALKGKYGDDFIWYQLFDKPIACFPRLRLRQGGDAWSDNLIADGMLESMCKGQLELGVQAYRPVVLFINGKYYGIQDLREQFDDQYFTNNYNVDPTSKDEVRSTFLPVPGKTVEGWELVSGSWDSYYALLESARGEMTDARYDQIKTQININSFVDFFCAVVYGKQISWGHNQDLWKVNTTKWQWLCTDFDRALVYEDNFAKIDFNNFTGAAGVSGSIMTQDSLFPKLMANVNFKHYFTQRFAAHLNSTFESFRMTSIVDSLASIIRPEMKEYVAKWGKEKNAIVSTDAWEKSVQDIQKFCKERGKHIFSFFTEDPFNYLGTVDLTIQPSDENSGDIFINGVRMCSGLGSLTFVKDCPMEIQAVAKPGFVFTGWNGGTSVDPLTVVLAGDSIITAKFEPSGLHVVPALIAVDTTFNLTDNPYVLPDNCTIAAGATLTIEKGVTLKMAQAVDIIVKGRLLVNGTADAPVTFAANTDAGAKNWGALSFYTLDTCKLTCLTFTGATIGDDALNERAAINGNNSNVIMDRLNVSNVIYPFYFEYGYVVLQNSSIIIDHICNGGIHVGRCMAIVENNIWLSTGKTINTDAIDVKGTDGAIVRGNRLYNFNGANSDGIDLGEKAINTLVEGNYVFGNRDKGISCGGGSTGIIRNNIVVNCDLGIGIKDAGSVVQLDHNTFVRNRIAVAAYQKAFGRGGGTAKVTNCILADSKVGSIFKDQYSTIDVSYSCSSTDKLSGTGNILADPYFIDPLNNNFQIQPFSQCVNNGDPAFEKDADGSVTDIGAQYIFNPNDFPTTVAAPYAPPQVIISEIMYDDGPNLNSNDWVELYNPTDEAISLANWKLTDKGDYRNWLASYNLADIDSSDIFFFPADAQIPAKGYLVICKNLVDFKTAYANAHSYIGEFPFKLDGNETILLFNDTDELVNALSYDNSNPWPKAANGKGPSLELVSAMSPNYAPMNWGASINTGGTPGAANTASGIIRPVTARAPLSFLLAQNYPNPCRYLTTIRFAVPKEGHVNISVYNISGRLLETLTNDKFPAGTHTVRWNVKKYSPGVYFYRIRTDRFVMTKKLTIQ